jgi:metal-responsive CopG/Arc/MetJ family transcriptional regulator
MRLEPKTNDKVERLTVRLSTQMMQEIEDLAYLKRLTLSQLLREAVLSYILTENYRY